MKSLLLKRVHDQISNFRQSIFTNKVSRPSKIVLSILFLTMFSVQSFSQVNPDLVGYWKMDQNSGTNVNDETANGLNGTFVGSLSFTQSGAFSGAGNALNFSGGYVNVPNNPAINQMQNSMTIEAWIFQTDNANNTIVDRGNYNFLFEINPNGQPGLGFYNPNGGWSYSSSNIPINQWVHVAMTWDGSTKTLNFYTNGILTDTFIRPSALFFNDSELNIGRQQPDGCRCNLMNGQIDELRLWKVVRSESDIQAAINVIPDTTPPFVDFGSEFTIELDENGNAIVTVDAVGGDEFDDNGELLTFAFSQTDFDCSYIGTPTEITITVTNAAGISASTVMSAIVEDNMGPILVTNDVVVQLDAEGNGSYTNEELFSTETRDNCGGQISFQGAGTVNRDDVAASPFEVVVKGTDQNGNTTRTRATITVLDYVVDETPPVAIAQDITVQLDENGTASITPEQINNGSTDDSGGDLSYTLDRTNFSCTDLSASCSDSSIEFDGTGIASGANGDNIQNLGLNQLTMEAWVKPNGGTVNSIIRKAGDYDLYIANNILYAEVWYEGRASSAQYLYAGPSVSDNVWSHLAFTFDKGNNGSGKFYVNGVETVASGTARSIAQDITLGIGGSTEFGQSFTGLIDDVRIWSTERTNAEINEFKDFCIGANSVGLEAYFKIEANEGTTLTDYSGNGNHLTITGTSWSTEGAPLESQGVEVTLTVTDASNNSSAAIANVIVLDNIAPEITAPADIDVFATSAAGAVVNYTVPVGTDNCSVTTALTAGLGDGVTFPIGTTVVTYTAIDGSGNETSASFNVNVTGTAPVITAADITVNNDPDVCGAVVSYATTETTVGIPAATITYSIAPGSSFEVGTVAVTATATNAVGSSTSTFNVTVEDNQVPNVITKDITVTLDVNGNASIVPSQVDDGSNDNCSIASFALSGVQSTTETLSFQQGDGSAFSETDATQLFAFSRDQNLTSSIQLSTDDQLNGQLSLIRFSDIFGNAQGQIPTGATITSAVLEVRTFDNSSASVQNVHEVLTDWDETSVTYNSFGTTQGVQPGEDYNATPVAGFTPNAANSFASVSIIDLVKSWRSGSNNGLILVNSTSDGYVFGSEDNPNTTFRPKLTVTYEVAQTELNFDCSDLGDNTVSLQATDASGNVTTGTATVTVIDEIAPVITLNGDLRVFHNAYTTFTDPSTTVDDNCSATVSVQGVVDVNTPGSYNLVYTATDGSQNSSSVSRTVIVRDITSPTVVTQPTTASLDANGDASITLQDVVTNSTDDSGVVNPTLSNTEFACDDLGDNTVLISAEDGNGNSLAIPQNGLIGYWKFGGANPLVDLTGNWGDIEFVGNASLNNGALDVNSNGFARTTGYNGQTITSKTLISYVALENLNVRSGSAMSIDGVSNDNFDAIVYAERQVRRWMNGSTSFRRTQDLNPGFAETQANQLVQMAITYEVVNGQVNITMYRNGIEIGTYSDPDDTFWTPNNVEILFGARHSAGNNQIGGIDARIEKALLYNRALSAQEIQAMNGTPVAVTVIDEIVPVITAPADIDVFATSAAGAMVNYATPVGTDNCSVTTALTAGFADGATFPIGTTVVTYTATDASGNAASTSFNVNVTGLPPEIVVPANITVSNDAGECGAIVDYIATETTAIPASVITYDTEPGSNFALGTAVVTATATNAVGTSTKSFTVTVEDNIAPVIAAPANISVFATSTAGAVVNYATPVGTDNCTVTTLLTAGLADGAIFPIGTTTVTYTATDASGNATSASFNVEVEGLAPEIIVPANITVSNDAGECGAIVDYIATETTAIPASVITYDIGPGSNFALGTTVVTATASNAIGTSTKSFTITVSDDELPTVITKGATVTLGANGVYSVNVDDINNGSFDNCNFDLSVDVTTLDCSMLGANTVTLTATDASGNTTSETAVITVVDNSGPVIIANDIEVFLDTNGSASIALEDVNGGITDGCGVSATSLDITSFDCSNLGANTVTITATDIHGNTSSQRATVTVIDNIAPTVVTKDITVDLDSYGNASITPDDVLVQEETTEYCSVSNARGYGVLLYRYIKRYRRTSNTRVSAFVFLARGRTFRKNPDGTATITGYMVDRRDAGDSWLVTINLKNARTWEEWSALGRTFDGNRNRVGDKYLDWTYYEIAKGSMLRGTGRNRGESILVRNSRGIQVGNGANTLNSNYGIGGLMSYVNRRGQTSSGRVYFSLDNCISNTKTPEGPLTEDNCEIVSTSLDIVNFDCSNIGANTVNVTVTDESGNSTTVPLTVTIRDNVKPIVKAKRIYYAVLGPNGSVTIDPAQIDAGSTDNCGIVSYSLSKDTFSCRDTYYRYGQNVRFTVTDASGNSSSTFVNIRTADTEAPVISREPIILVVYGRRRFQVSRRDIESRVTDNCEVGYLYYQRTSFTTKNVGLNYIRVTALDRGGRRANGYVRVNVVDISQYRRTVPMCYRGRSINVRHQQVQRWLSRGAYIGNCPQNMARPQIADDIAEEILDLTSVTPDLKLSSSPNPTPDYTLVSFSSQLSGPAKVTIYNTNGIEMDNLFDDELVAKRRVEVGYDVGKLPSGIYIIRMVTAGEVKTMKLVVRK